jgi:hypothetical protein
MTTSPAPHPLPALDVLADEVAAAVKPGWVSPSPMRLRWLADHAQPALAGDLAEYSHLLHDADPDSTVRQFPDLAKGKPWRAS